jgi:hypothetical protein
MAKPKPRHTAKTAAEGEALHDVLSRLDHDSVVYEVGDQVSLDAATAEELIRLRVVRAAATETPAA